MDQVANNSLTGGRMTDRLPTLAKEGIKLAPGAGVTIWDSVLGMPIEKWVSVATLTLICLQIGFLLYDRLVRQRKGA
jgi:hypothetical protein